MQAGAHLLATPQLVSDPERYKVVGKRHFTPCENFLYRLEPVPCPAQEGIGQMLRYYFLRLQRTARNSSIIAYHSFDMLNKKIMKRFTMKLVSEAYLDP